MAEELSQRDRFNLRLEELWNAQIEPLSLGQKIAAAIEIGLAPEAEGGNVTAYKDEHGELWLDFCFADGSTVVLSVLDFWEESERL